MVKGNRFLVLWDIDNRLQITQHLRNLSNFQSKEFRDPSNWKGLAEEREGR
jgi:hypothetical protein